MKKLNNMLAKFLNAITSPIGFPLSVLFIFSIIPFFSCDGKKEKEIPKSLCDAIIVNITDNPKDWTFKNFQSDTTLDRITVLRVWENSKCGIKLEENIFMNYTLGLRMLTPDTLNFSIPDQLKLSSAYFNIYEKPASDSASVRLKHYNDSIDAHRDEIEKSIINKLCK